MSNLKVIRKTLTGDSEDFTFDVLGLRFLVKNFSDEDILVNFDPITNENESSSIKVPKQFSQLVLIDETIPLGQNTLYVKGTGEVEVQIVMRRFE